LKILKYTIPQIPSVFKVKMPSDAVIVSVGVQINNPVVWVTTELVNNLKYRYFRIVYTGEEFGANVTHRGTIQLNDGIVLHILEIHK
jgi:hypothetical protein